MSSLHQLQNPDEIYPIPEIPSKIKSAVSEEKLIVFIGASASRIIGCLGWEELAEYLVDISYEKKLINHWEQGRLKNNDSRKIISILKNVLEKDDYEKALENSLQTKPDLLEKFPIYKHLIKLRSIYITTNIDTCFDSFFEQPRIYIKPSQFKTENVKQNTLFKLHGSIADHQSVIFTTQDYISHYNRIEVKDFLNSLFNSDYFVLFVGYSLAELEILDYVLLKGDFEKSQDNKLKEAKHFLLLPFYRSEKGLLRFERSYFNTLKVVIVPYAIDDRGYEQLHFVIKAWEKEINISTPYLFKSYKFIEDNVDDHIDSNAPEILQLIKNDDHFRDHFFKRLRTIKWFDSLKEKEYFSPENVPPLVPAGQEGYYSIPEWNVLPYLERVSQQINLAGNERYIDELLAIIKEVSNYKDANGHPIDNYRTWYYFVKILLNIPNEKITFEIIDSIPTWLDSKFDTMSQGSEIATKLLPKFLPEVTTPDDAQKAEKIVNYITEVKWVKLPERLREGILGKEEEPKTVVDQYWLLESFAKQQNAAKVGEKCSEKIIYIIADRLKEILRRKRPIHWNDIEHENKIYRISVYHTKDYEFDCSVGVIKEEQLKADKAEEIFFKTLSATPEEIFRFKISDCRNVEHFEEKIKTEISKSTIAKEIEDKLDDKLSHLYESIFSDYSYIWFRSISEGTGLTVHETKETLTVILRDILLAKTKKNTSVSKNISKEFMGDKYQYPLFKRLVLFVIGECWNDLKQEFWKMVNAEGGEHLFNDSDYEAEVYILLEKNIMRFTPEEKERLQLIVEHGPQGYLPEENRDRYISYWKQTWYSAVKTDSHFKALYEEKKKLTQTEEELHFRGEKSRWGSGPSPLSKEDILSMSNQELAEFLRTFETKDHWKGPTVEGLGTLLKLTVQEKPEKFIDDLTPFLNTFYSYVVEILWGIRDAWNEKKAIDWGKLFDFIKKYIDRNEFWQNKFKIVDIHRSIADHEWVIGMIGDLIQEGTKSDNWAFEEKYFSVAQEIIFLIIENLQVKEEKEISDPVTHALNSPFGKTITALIYLAWHIAKTEDRRGKKEEVKWSDNLKNKYEEILEKGVVEAYTLFGQYIQSLYYLDKLWVEQKIKKLESIQKIQLWSVFMNGYLFGSRVYDDLYKLMGKHYLKAMSYTFKEEHSEEGLVQHIAIGYLRDLEDLTENSLFGMMLKKWSPSQIREIIGFFWIQRDYLVRSIDTGVPIPGSDENEKIKNKIIEFWRWLYKQYKDEESLDDDDKKILSSVAKLTVFLPKLDRESFEWLILSAQYVNLDFNSPFFIESLDELKDKGDKIESGRYVGKIFLKMLDVFTPDYDEKHIRSIVEFLYNSGADENARKICNIYGSRGYEFLRDIYENNANNRL